MIGVKQVHEELAKASSMVMTARRLLAGGGSVDLSALEEKITFVCEHSLQLDREEGRKLIPLMERLANDLDFLFAAVQEQMEVFAPDVSKDPSAEPT